MTTINTRRLPVHRGPAAWAEILGPGATYPTLGEDCKADVLIIGAGFAGLSAARRLLQLDPALDVVLVDAGKIAEGGTGRNSGFMIDIPHELTSDDYSGSDDRALIQLNRMAQTFAAEAVSDYEIPPEFFDKAGKINGAATARADAHNKTLAAHLSNLGEPFERLDAAQMTEVTGSRYYRSGLYTPGTIMLQTAGFIRGLAAGLVQAGVTLHEKTPVTALSRSNGSWQASTPGGRISAPKVLLTVNGHLESFGFARQRLLHVFLFAAMTPDLPTDAVAGRPRWGITPSDPMGTTMRRIDKAQGGNRIITRTCAALRPGMRASEPDLKRAARVMQAKFDDRYPALAGLRMEYTWAGHLCLAQNGTSHMKEVEDGLYSACVQNGLGTTRGTLTGIGAAELAMGTRSKITDFFDSQAAPTKLPPPLLQSIGGNGILRWKEWQARAE